MRPAASSPLIANPAKQPQQSAQATSEKTRHTMSDASTRSRLRRAWRPVKGRIFHVAWSPTDERLVTAGEHASLVWSFATNKFGEPEPSPVTKLAHDGTSMRCEWTTRGEQILTGSSDGLVTVHSVGDGSAMATLRASPSSEVYGLSMLSDQGLLGVAVGDCVQQWDLPRARQTARTEFPRADDSGVAYGGTRNPDRRAYVFGIAARGRALAAALSDGTCRLLDAQSLRPIHVLDDHARRGSSCFACALSRSTTQLATAAGDGTVLLYDLRALKRGPLGTLKGHSGAVHSITFASGGSLGSLCGQGAAEVAGASSGELCITGGDDGTLRIAKTHTREHVCSLRVSGAVLCAAVDHAQTRIACGGGSGVSATDNALSVCWPSALPTSAAAANCSPIPTSDMPEVRPAKSSRTVEAIPISTSVPDATDP